MGKKKKILIIVPVAVVLLSVVVVFARYIYTVSTGDKLVTAETFYFTTDITGDSYMVKKDSSPGVYEFQDIQEGTFDLYGGVGHEITFNVRNYDDELRITEKKIAYSVSITENNNVSLEKIDETGTTMVASSNEETLTGKTAQSDEYKLKINSGYADGAKVVVDIKSTKPFSKEIQLTFNLHTTSTWLDYEVRDSSGSPYAELIMKTYSFDESSSEIIQPTIMWNTDDLYIDNTNKLTYTYSNGSFTQNEGMTSGNMQISLNVLNLKGSESLYFFKSDASKDYSYVNENVITENYVIDLTPLPKSQTQSSGTETGKSTENTTVEEGGN
jgi:hypothetical protein